MSDLTPEKRAHYEWMLENCQLSPGHRGWIIDQLEGWNTRA